MREYLYGTGFFAQPALERFESGIHPVDDLWLANS
jgi:hypothetical protein